MRKFERIRIEKGQAYIRDTGISMSEIVSLYLTEKDTRSISQQYPSLETDDVIEALGYAVQDIRSIISSMGNDMRVPLTSMHGYTDLLLKFPQDTFSSEQRQEFIQTIQKNVFRLENFFIDFLDWNSLHYSDHQEFWEKFSLDKAIEGAFQSIQSHWPDAVITGQIPGNLPEVKSNYSLPNLFHKLAGDDLFGFLKHEVIWRKTASDGEHVIITIERPFAREEVTFAEVENFLSWSITPLALAAEILKKHGSELELIPGNESVIFKFSLPIWKAST